MSYIRALHDALCSPLVGIFVPLFGQLPCETNVETLDGLELEPIPLSDPSDIELVRGGFKERGAGNCCRLLLPWLWE